MYLRLCFFCWLFSCLLPSALSLDETTLYHRVTMVVLHPFSPELADRRSESFKEFGNHFATKVDALFTNLPGTKKSAVINIEKMEDPFESKVTLHISSKGYDNPEEIENLLKDHIREKRSIGPYSVDPDHFSFRNFGVTEIEDEVQFSGDGYVELSRELLPHTVENELEQIEIEFMTRQPNGLLLWHGQTPDTDGTGQDYLSVAVVDGYLVFSYELGSKPAVIRSSVKVDDGRPHRAVLRRQARDGCVQVDSNLLEFGESGGILTQLNTNGNIYIGGLPNLELMTGNPTTRGFNGCVLSLDINSRYVDFGTAAVSSVNTLPCSGNEDDLDDFVKLRSVEEFDNNNRSNTGSNLNPTSPPPPSVIMENTESGSHQSEISEDDVENIFKAPDQVDLSSAKNLNTIMEQRKEFLNCSASTLRNVNDEFEAVGSNVAAKLRRMDPSQELVAEQLILKVLVGGLNGNLTQNHDVVQMFVED